jgi:uncharacterized protein YkwD
MRVALLLSLVVVAPVRAQDCEHDDALARAASELLLSGSEWTSRQVTDAAHAAGSDAPTVHALYTHEPDASAWLARLGGSLRCGRAESERGTLWLAAPSLGHLEIVSADPLRVRASFTVGTGAATLFVLDARGETTAFEVPGSPTELDLGRDLALPATLQLVAAHADGPRPVAERTLGEPREASELSGDAPVLDAIEELRRSVEALPLRTSRLLARVASEHAEAVCSSGHVAHVIERGDAEARLDAAGVRARHVGEVVARGRDRAAAWRALTTSPSHHGALTDARFTDVGIGETTDEAGRTCMVVVLAAWPRRIR